MASKGVLGLLTLEAGGHFCMVTRCRVRPREGTADQGGEVSWSLCTGARGPWDVAEATRWEVALLVWLSAL